MKKKNGLMTGALCLMMVCVFTGCGNTGIANQDPSSEKNQVTEEQISGKQIEGEEKEREEIENKQEESKDDNADLSETDTAEVAVQTVVGSDTAGGEMQLESTVNAQEESDVKDIFLKQEQTTDVEVIAQETTQEPATEPVVIPEPGIEAYLRRDHFAGDVLVATDFQVTVTMPDGRILKNPRGWTATPLELAEGENTITICYDMLSTVITVYAAARPVEAPPAQPVSESPASVELSGNQIFALSGPAVLEETVDMGQEYLDKIVFVGDSRTYSYKAYGVLSGGRDTTQVWTPQNGTMTLAAQGYGLIVYPETGAEVSIRDAVAMKQPEYLVIGLGANGVSFMGEETFKAEYRSLVNDIKAISPGTKIMLNSIFPVASYYARQESINNQKIAVCNRWIMEIAEETGTKYLNTAEALVDASGVLDDRYDNHGDGMHLNRVGDEVVMQYIRIHAYP